MQAGFYIATNPVYGARACKVGYTGALERRLHDGEYQTCFIDEWAYAHTLETPNAVAAQAIETAVLRWYWDRRPRGNEMVCAPPGEIVEIAERQARDMQIAYARRDAPVYEPPADILERLPRPEIIRPDAELPIAKLPDADLPIAAEQPVAEQPVAELPEVVATRVVPRPYQEEAIAACVDELRARKRAVLQMACRSGKTYVAHRVALELGGPAAFLVPTLALLRQTARAVMSYPNPPARILLVGSGDGGMTTDPARIAAAVAAGAWIISTYHSAPLLPDFPVVVFDEAHRLCGATHPDDAAEARAEARLFQEYLMRPSTGYRLFMTATPNYTAKGLSMHREEVFGKVAYRYHLRSAVNAGYVNNFGLHLVPGDGLVEQLLAASRESPTMLVYCRTIAHAEALAAEFTAAAMAADPASVPTIACVHSKQPLAQRERTLDALRHGGRHVVFNCNMLSEGVEVARLDAVFFASERKSVVDIVQIICRPLTRVEGKMPSRVYVPYGSEMGMIVGIAEALIDEDPDFYYHILDPVRHPYDFGVVGAGDARRAEILLRVRQALRARPCYNRVARYPWPVMFEEVARIVRECRRYPKGEDRLVYGERILNTAAFYSACRAAYVDYAGIECDDAPGVNDVQFGAGLAPWQARQLESLPGWREWGAPGAYNRALTIPMMEALLEENGGRLPPMNVINGGYIGLDATREERVAGMCTTLNQQDPNQGGCRIKEPTLSRVTAIARRYGLVFPKPRDARGRVCGTTFIQDAYAEFKALVARDGERCEAVQRAYPDYPHKHRLQECRAALAAGAVPARRASKKLRDAISSEIGIDPARQQIIDAFLALNI